MEQKNDLSIGMLEMNDVQSFVNDSIIDDLFNTSSLNNTITHEPHDFHNLETGIPDMDHNYLSQLLHAVMESESKKSAVKFVSMSEVERIPASEINAFNDFRPSSESNFQFSNYDEKEEDNDQSSNNESNQDSSQADDDTDDEVINEVESQQVMIVDHKMDDVVDIDFVEDEEDYASDIHHGIELSKKSRKSNDNHGNHYDDENSASNVIDSFVVGNDTVQNRNGNTKKRKIGISSARIIADAIKESIIYRERMWNEKLKFENESINKEYEIQKNRIELEKRRLQFERQQLRFEHDIKFKELELKISQLSQKDSY